MNTEQTFLHSAKSFLYPKGLLAFQKGNPAFRKACDVISPGFAVSERNCVKISTTLFARRKETLFVVFF